MALNSETARDNYAAYAYARDTGHLDFITKAARCDDYFDGQHWQSGVRAYLENLGKPVITINKVLSTVAAVWGEQLSHRADVAFRPSRGGNPETAQTMDLLWLHTVNANNYNWLESQMAAEAFIRSRGFIDLRVNFDDQLQGEARFSLLNSKNVLIDPDASQYDPDTWGEVILTKWLPPRDIERMYGAAALREIQATGSATSQFRYDVADWLPDTFGGKELYGGYDSYREQERRTIYRLIERQYKENHWADCFVNTQTGDMREIPKSWDRERIAKVMQEYSLGLYRKKVEKIRWTVSTDDVTVHDEISPLKHFTPIPFFPFFLHGRTIGIVENMLSPQDLLNKSISQELHVINTTANSGWIVREGQLVQMTPEELEERGAEDGLVLRVAGDIDKAVKKITPNQIPQGLDRTSFKADEYLKETSMISDSMRGFDRADVAAKAIRAKQARGTVSLASPFNNLDFTRQIAARNVLDIWQHYYTEERVFQMTTRDLGDEPEEIVLNRVEASGEVVNDLTVGEYSTIISTVPARESYEETQFDEAMRLRTEAGIAIPDDIMVEHSHLDRKGEIAKRIKRLNGGEEPSQAQKELQAELQRLEIEEKRADTAEKSAKAQLAGANAALSAARAQREIAEMGASGERTDDQSLEAVKVALEREKAAGELQLKRVTELGELQIKRDELELKREELALKREELEIKEKEAAARTKAMVTTTTPVTGAAT